MKAKGVLLRGKKGTEKGVGRQEASGWEKEQHIMT